MSMEEAGKEGIIREGKELDMSKKSKIHLVQCHSHLGCRSCNEGIQC